MRLALVFSGQGGQRPEHLARLRREAPADLAPALARSLGGLWQADPADGDALAANAIAQPLIFGLQMSQWARLRPLLPRPVCAAGYSLGEMAAAAAAGAFPAPAGVELCAERAALMDAATPGPSGMLAVLGLEATTVADIAGRAGLAVAIRNGPRHLVLAGPADRLDGAEAEALARGASRTVRLAVRTPSHTAVLAAAGEAFGRRLAEWPDGRLDFPVLSAIDGLPARTRGAAFAALARQIGSALDWEACMATLAEMQPDAVLEIGPGNALCRLLAELAPDLPARACDDFRSLEAAAAWVRSLER
ncbi:MAG TPA: acyltransferase domain-containing protein [Rhodocyclaceae bacterium]|nr:acyltransferase domain-containing protein [Rhodocyclaceae bacterium]